MKKIPIILIFVVILITIISSLSGCKNNSSEKMLEKFYSDTLDVYSELTPNEDLLSNIVTYGKDSIKGYKVKNIFSTDSSEVYIDYNITFLDINPKINNDLISFIHEVTYDSGFINEKDSLVPRDLTNLIDDGLTLHEGVQKILDWENICFKNQLPEIFEIGGNRFNLEVDVYPVYMDEDFITFRKYAYIYTGGANGNTISSLVTYNMKNGNKLELNDLIENNKIDKLRQLVIKHMASSYPIDEKDTSVEQYLHSLNDWLGIPNLKEEQGNEGVFQKRITENNYPIKDPGINAHGLVFTYDKYQLTPGSEGVPVIILTYDEIGNYLNPPFNKLR